MTYYVTALENTRARLIASETSTDSPIIADMIAAHYEAQGFVVVRRAVG